MRVELFSRLSTGGSCEMTTQLQKRIDSTLMRQIQDGEPVCFRVFVDAQEWLEENNRYADIPRTIAVFIHPPSNFVFAPVAGQASWRLLRVSL